MFPLWSLKATRKPVAEIIYPNRAMEYYLIDPLINNEFFIIKKVGVFRIQSGVSKILGGKVRIFQYNVESMNPVDASMQEDIEKFCKTNKFTELLPLMTEVFEKDKQAGKFHIHEPLSPRATLYLHNFRNIDPVHVYNFYTAQDQAHEESKKWMSKKVFPKIEAKMIFAILVGGAVAFAIVASTVGSGNFDFDSIIPKALKGEEFLLGIKLLLHN